MCAVRSSTGTGAIHTAPPQTIISVNFWRNGARPAEAGVAHTQHTVGEFMKTHVPKWRTTLAVTMGGAMLATSAMAQSGAGSSPSSANTTRAVQQALKDRGHDPGEVDGAMGPKTQAALRDFQQKEGLKATGVADADTMARLAASASIPPGAQSGESPSATGTSKDETFTGATETN
jgi:putative peptidoglycan binding protein